MKRWFSQTRVLSRLDAVGSELKESTQSSGSLQGGYGIGELFLRPIQLRLDSSLKVSRWTNELLNRPLFGFEPLVKRDEIAYGNLRRRRSSKAPYDHEEGTRRDGSRDKHPCWQMY